MGLLSDQQVEKVVLLKKFFVTFFETGLAYFRVKKERLSDSNAYTPVKNREQNISVNFL
jgi:hypothetical protein